MQEWQWLESVDPVALLGVWLGEPLDPRPPSAPRPSTRKLRLLACAISHQLIRPRDCFQDERADVLQRAEHWADTGIRGPVQSIDQYWWAMEADPVRGCRNLLEMTDTGQCQQFAHLLRDIAGNPFQPMTLPKGPAVKCKRCDGDGWVCLDDGWGARDKCKVCNGQGTLGLFLACPWLTPTVLVMAQEAYARRDFSTLPILGDALEDAGCQEELLLRHLRGEEPCWLCVRTHGTRNDSCSVCGSMIGPHSHSTGWVPFQGPHNIGCWALDRVLGKE